MADEPSKQNTQDVEKEQEALLMAKYGGGLKPKKKLLPKDHKFFDSADWAMAKEKKAPGQAPPQEDVANLPPKLEPMPLPARRISHMDPMEKPAN